MTLQEKEQKYEGKGGSNASDRVVILETRYRHSCYRCTQHNKSGTNAHLAVLTNSACLSLYIVATTASYSA
jgi:hypothetical protein